MGVIDDSLFKKIKAKVTRRTTANKFRSAIVPGIFKIKINKAKLLKTNNFIGCILKKLNIRFILYK